MFQNTSTHHLSQPFPINSSLQNMVVDLDPQHEESISAGGHLSVIPIFLAQSSKTQPGKQGGHMTVLGD